MGWEMRRVEYYCPKCNSKRIEVARLDKDEVGTKHVSIDQLGTQNYPIASDLVLRYYVYGVKCLDCGYKIEYTTY